MAIILLFYCDTNCCGAEASHEYPQHMFYSMKFLDALDMTELALVQLDYATIFTFSKQSFNESL